MPSYQNYEIDTIIVHLADENLLSQITGKDHTALKFRRSIWNKAKSLQSALNHSTRCLKKIKWQVNERRFIKRICQWRSSKQIRETGQGSVHQSIGGQKGCF